LCERGDGNNVELYKEKPDDIKSIGEGRIIFDRAGT